MSDDGGMREMEQLASGEDKPVTGMGPAGSGALCAAQTRSGRRCKRRALPDSVFCAVHRERLEHADTKATDGAMRAYDPEPDGAQVAKGVERSGRKRGLGNANISPTAEPALRAEKSSGHASGAGEVVGPEDPTDQQLRHRLLTELDSLIRRLAAQTPDHIPPPFSARGLLQALDQNLAALAPGMGVGILQRLRGAIGEEVFDPETWKGIWFVLNYAMRYNAGVAGRRFTGEYQVDEWGLDWEFLDLVKPFFEFMYRIYWRVEASGLENVPNEGKGLIVANHSGQLPWDASMVAASVMLDHPAQRLVRSLYASWFPTLPFFSVVFEKCGQTLASVDNGTRLLEQDQLVAVYPEGFKGVGKLYRERYRLARFGRGGFVRMALNSQAPIIPVAVVGAEETYISLAKSPTMARITGFPFFPISPTFPWLGLLGFVPLPTKWYIDFGEPIPMDGYGPDAADNLVLVSQLTDQVRNVVQGMIYARLARRRSVFLG